MPATLSAPRRHGCREPSPVTPSAWRQGAPPRGLCPWAPRSHDPLPCPPLRPLWPQKNPASWPGRRCLAPRWPCLQIRPKSRRLWGWPDRSAHQISEVWETALPVRPRRAGSPGTQSRATTSSRGCRPFPPAHRTKAPASHWGHRMRPRPLTAQVGPSWEADHPGLVRGERSRAQSLPAGQSLGTWGDSSPRPSATGLTQRRTKRRLPR